MKFKLLIIILLLSGSLSAQYLRKAVGLRGGLSSGITFQYYYQEDRDLKGLMSFRNQGLQITGLIEQYVPLELHFGDHFYAYYGFGAHVGYVHVPSDQWLGYNQYPYDYHNYGGRFVIGGDGIVGAEYRVFVVPLTFGIDYKPFFELFGYDIFRLAMGDFALTIKYNF